MENFSCKWCFTFLRISTQCSSIGGVLFFASTMSFSVTEIISGAHFNDSPNLHNSCSPDITHMEPYCVKKQFQINMRRNKINSGSNKSKAHFWIRHRKKYVNNWAGTVQQVCHDWIQDPKLARQFPSVLKATMWPRPLTRGRARKNEGKWEGKKE